jgi:hypothetical protein
MVRCCCSHKGVYSQAHFGIYVVAEEGVSTGARPSILLITRKMLSIYINGLQIFLLCGNALKATAYKRSMAVITWLSRGRRSSIYFEAAFG